MDSIKAETVKLPNGKSLLSYKVEECGWMVWMLYDSETKISEMIGVMPLKLGGD